MVKAPATRGRWPLAERQRVHSVQARGRSGASISPCSINVRRGSPRLSTSSAVGLTSVAAAAASASASAVVGSAAAGPVSVSSGFVVVSIIDALTSAEAKSFPEQPPRKEYPQYLPLMCTRNDVLSLQLDSPRVKRRLPALSARPSRPVPEGASLATTGNCAASNGLVGRKRACEGGGQSQLSSAWSAGGTQQWLGRRGRSSMRSAGAVRRLPSESHYGAS